MITMDLISHDISLYRYTVTDVIEIHLLEPGVVFHSIPSTPGQCQVCVLYHALVISALDRIPGTPRAANVI